MLVAERMTTMKFGDFFEEVVDPASPWGPSRTTAIRMDLVRRLANGPIPGDDPLATAIALTQFVRGQYQSYGTDNKQQLDDVESREALRSLRAVLRRHGVKFDPQWSDFPSFRTYWNAHEGKGSWQARRDMLSDLFDPVLEALEAAQDRASENEVARPVSPRSQLGWPTVDEHIEQLRQRFATASTPVDYKDVGNRCVGVLEALSAVVYDSAVHCPDGKEEPPVNKTDIRIGAYIDQRLAGPSNEELRGLVKKASALSHKMKHSPSADRTTAGIAADAVILLANILRRLCRES